MQITAKQALSIINSYKNQPKRTYVKVADRDAQRLEIIGSEMNIVISTIVYSKTWSKKIARLVDKDGHTVGTKAAIKILGALSC